MQRRRAVSRKQNRRVHALITLIFCIAVFILVCAGCFLLVKTDGTITNKPNQSQGDSSSAAPDGADSTTDGDSQQEQPTMTEEEQRIADATSTRPQTAPRMPRRWWTRRFGMSAAKP